MREFAHLPSKDGSAQRVGGSDFILTGFPQEIVHLQSLHAQAQRFLVLRDQLSFTTFSVFFPIHSLLLQAGVEGSRSGWLLGWQLGFLLVGRPAVFVRDRLDGLYVGDELIRGEVAEGVESAVETHSGGVCVLA